GEHELKGVPARWRLFRVVARTSTGELGDLRTEVSDEPTGNVPEPTSEVSSGAHRRQSSTGSTSRVEEQSTGDALQLDGPDPGERHQPPIGRIHDLLAHQHLAR